jgi:hypothetical protein
MPSRKTLRMIARPPRSVSRAVLFQVSSKASFGRGCFHRWSLAMHPSRRTLVASLAALPMVAISAAAKTTADTPVGGQDDPIFAAIDRHNAAIAALENIEEDNERDAYAEALQELADAHDALMDTVPLTIAGCRALVEHMIDLGAGVDEALEALRQALDRIATAT